METPVRLPSRRRIVDCGRPPVPCGGQENDPAPVADAPRWGAFQHVASASGASIDETLTTTVWGRRRSW